MSLINITNLTFAYEGSYDNIFENVSFQINTNWKLGFTGRCGRGKTTFLNLLMGKYDYKGTISSSINFEYFPYEVENKQAYTIDVIKTILLDYEEWQLFRELNLIDVSIDVLYRPFSTLSNGEQTKILLVVLFLKSNSFLLIDEPTNHLDLTARKIVSQYLNKKSGFILVSHDRKFLDNCVDHILSINNTNIEVQRGNFSTWCHNKKLQDNFEISENSKLNKDIKRLQLAAQQTTNWSNKLEKTKHGTRNSGLRPDRGHIGHKSAKMMKRSKSIEERQQNAIEEKAKLLKNVETSEFLKISPLKYHTDTLVQLEDLDIFYDDKLVCKNVSFSVNSGDKIAICGKNGTGKSTILKLILGEDITFEGLFKKNSNLKVSYVCQDATNLQGNLADYASQNNIDESLFKAILRKLDFTRIQFEKNMKDYSSGQKKKVLIARSLCEQAHLYIWDEPLNYIDVLSRLQIETLIKKYSPTILFVEHDSEFCNDIATKTVLL